MGTEVAGSKTKQALIAKGKVVAIAQQSCSPAVYYVEMSDRYVQSKGCSKYLPNEIPITAFSIAIGQGANVTRYYALRLNYETWLDYDEIDEFFAGIDVVKSMMNRMRSSSPENKDIYFCTRDGFRVGFTQESSSADQISYVMIGDEFTKKLNIRQAKTFELIGEEAALNALLPSVDASSDFDNLIAVIAEGKSLLDAWQQQDRVA